MNLRLWRSPCCPTCYWWLTQGVKMILVMRRRRSCYYHTYFFFYKFSTFELDWFTLDYLLRGRPCWVMIPSEDFTLPMFLWEVRKKLSLSMTLNGIMTLYKHRLVGAKNLFSFWNLSSLWCSDGTLLFPNNIMLRRQWPWVFLSICTYLQRSFLILYTPSTILYSIINIKNLSYFFRCNNTYL